MTTLPDGPTEYLAWLRSRGYAASTIWATGKALEFFFTRASMDPSGVTVADVAAHHRRLLRRKHKRTGRPFGPVRIQQWMNVLHRYFAHEVRRGRVLMNPAPKIERRGGPALPRSIPDQDQTRRLLDQPDTRTPVGVRDRAILELFYSTGVRRGELARLTLYDVDFDDNTIRIRRGKWNKDRMLPLGRTAKRWLQRYLQGRRPPGVTALFLTQFQKGFHPVSLNNILKKYLALAGLPWKMNCHLLRHACATHMLQGGANVRYVQELLGHARLGSTEVYTHLHPQDLKDAHRRAHPHGRLAKVLKT